MVLLLLLLCFWTEWAVECHQCPPPTLKNRHASNVCNDVAHYHCLWNTLKDDYGDVCLKPEPSYTPGSYVVYSNALNAKRCPPNRYQPFAYSTNDLNECVYKKSNCTEEGQISAGGGTYTEDATCKCDYTKGYSYIRLPSDPCQCNPAVNDCSCYLTQCLNRTHKLSPDYKCEEINRNIIRQYKCPKIKLKPEENDHHRDVYNTTRKDYKDNIVRHPVDTFFVARIVTGLVFLMAVVFLVIFVTLMYNTNDTEPESDTALQALLDRSFNYYRRTMQEDSIVYDTHSFKHAKIITETNPIVILKGRHGSGKTTLALQLASTFMNQKYKLAIISRDDKSVLGEIQRSSEKFVIILEKWFDPSDTNAVLIKSQTEMLNSHNFRGDFQIIVTATKLDEHRLEELRINGIITGNNVANLDLQTPALIEDNESILRCQLEKYNRKLSNEEITEAAETNTYYGFPRQCVLFCQDSRNFQLGTKYFRQPPGALIYIINQLKSSENQNDRIMYSVLVYIILNPESGLRVNDLDMVKINSIFKELYSTSFWKKSITEISEKDVTDACCVCYSQHILMRNNVYFLAPVVYQAVMVVYADTKSCLDKTIKTCDFMQILDIVRPLIYEQLEGEVVLIIDRKKSDSAVDILAKRMAIACLDDEIVIPKIITYITKCKFTHVLQKISSHLETNLKILFTDQRINNVIILMADITADNNLELLDYTPTTFVLTWAFIALQKSKRNDLFESLVERYIKRRNTKIPVDILRTVVDQYNNTFLHYCVLWWHNKDNAFIRYLENEFRLRFDEWVKYTDKNFELANTNQMSAVDFAAYFGNHELLKTFVRFQLKTASTKALPAGQVAKVIKDTETLLQYTSNGRTNRTIESYSSCPFINITICGPIDVNETFNYDKATEALNSFKEKS